MNKNDNLKREALLYETPSGLRTHIGIFGRTNSGKSSFLNAFCNQKAAIVSDTAGTTTDPVSVAIEVQPIGPCLITDTAGFADASILSEYREDSSLKAAERTDIAVIVTTAECFKEDFSVEKNLLEHFENSSIPVIFLVNKSDLYKDSEQIAALLEKETGKKAFAVSTKKTTESEGINRISNPFSDIVKEMVRILPQANEGTILKNLVKAKDIVLLVMPQDIQAPKGRLILPQVQTLRELLDKNCQVLCCKTEEYTDVLSMLKQEPKLIITDSQVFKYVYDNKPENSRITSFSVLFAAYKGDISYYIEGVKELGRLKADARILIAECCSHAPLEEDIGRVKIPNLLRRRFGDKIKIDIVGGKDFPEDLSGYDLIIQCGGCMFNRRHIMSRINKAKTQGVPMTNYGIFIACMNDILDKIVYE